MREAREGLSLALWVLVGVLAVACAVGGIQVAQAHDARARESAQHARYDATLDAASALRAGLALAGRTPASSTALTPGTPHVGSTGSAR